MSFRCRRHSRRIETKELLPFLIADPEFLLIGWQANSMGTMTNRLVTRNHALQNLAGFQVDNVKADSFAQTYIRNGVRTVHGVRKDAVLAHIFYLLYHLFVNRVEDGEHRLGPQIDQPAIQTDEAVVGLRPYPNPLEQVSILGVDDKESSVLGLVPPSTGHIELLPVYRDRGSVGTDFIGFLPYDLVFFQVKGADPPVRC